MVYFKGLRYWLVVVSLSFLHLPRKTTSRIRWDFGHMLVINLKEIVAAIYCTTSTSTSSKMSSALPVLTTSTSKEDSGVT